MKTEGLYERGSIWPSQESDLLWVICPSLAILTPPPASFKGLHFPQSLGTRTCPHLEVESTPPYTSHLLGSQFLQCRLCALQLRVLPAHPPPV